LCLYAAVGIIFQREREQTDDPVASIIRKTK